jgi:hypothetical protein
MIELKQAIIEAGAARTSLFYTDHWSGSYWSFYYLIRSVVSGLYHFVSFGDDRFNAILITCGAVNLLHHREKEMGK